MTTAPRLTMQITSPDGILYDGETLHATFPGLLGIFSVYPRHAPLIAALKKGEIVYYIKEDERQTIAIRSGMVEVNHNRVTVCVEK
jgi:F-type H+-transporting ATPase subunit epsilon